MASAAAVSQYAADLDVKVIAAITDKSDEQLLSAEEARRQLAACRSLLAEMRSQLLETREALAEKTIQSERLAQEFRDCTASLAALRSVVDAANAPIVAVDKAGLVVEWNRKAAEVFRCEGRAALRRQLADWLHKADRPGLLELEQATLSSGAGLQRGFRVRCRSEDEPWHELLLCASPRRSVSASALDGASCSTAGVVESTSGGSGLAVAAGAVEGVLYVGQDLAGHRREKLEVELAVQDLTRLLSTLNAPIIGIDSTGTVNQWNRKAELLTGFPADEALGKTLVKAFITKDFADSVQTMLTQVLSGLEITNYEIPVLTKSGQRREILCSATARRDRSDKVVGVIIVGQDITELRSESKMLANYVRICGAAVWSLRGNAMTGAVTDSKTKEIEHLISQQAQMDVCDPRMVLWRASFVSILKTMCQNFWVRRKEAQGQSQKVGGVGTAVFTTDFGYEFCFEAPNGSVKWYKVQGHLIQECSYDSQFEVTGSMQEVTSMLIDKVMGDRWQKWWNRMCHMVFDATLLVDTQEYRVLNAWGEEKVFGSKLQSHHPLLHLIKPEDTVSLKEAFNEVTFKGFERGRTLHLLRPGCDEYKPAQCFLLSADQENPNECMMGIRMQVSGTQEENVSVLWDVAKPNPVLTLEDLARLKSGLKRTHRRPSRANVRRPLPHRSRSSDPHASSHSLSSIPEDLHGEFEENAQLSDRSEAADSGVEGTESLRSSSKSSNSSKSSTGSASEGGVCNSSPARSACEEPSRDSPLNAGGTCGEHQSDRFRLNRNSVPPKLLTGGMRAKIRASTSPRPLLRSGLPSIRVGPAKVKLKWGGRIIEEALDLDEFATVQALRERICSLTSVPPSRQTLILAGKQLSQKEGPLEALAAEWSEMRDLVKPGQALMLVGSVPPPGEVPALVPPSTSTAPPPGSAVLGARMQNAACSGGTLGLRPGEATSIAAAVVPREGAPAKEEEERAATEEVGGAAEQARGGANGSGDRSGAVGEGGGEGGGGDAATAETTSPHGPTADEEVGVVGDGLRDNGTRNLEECPEANVGQGGESAAEAPVEAEDSAAADGSAVAAAGSVPSEGRESRHS
mmetsp:Transcript_74972/g.194952  ORF Transcript_74972/g.194952 Transcript_74972/m.194952 type:complete len:1085 (+) Transcript_74972:172-3426(+)|eukprot:CAMPEP_0115178644 /NCGR_PEP_ID=MMETSP0270-20121206/6005_1 /TAXON_ID=71861 /ORGANISM="Scrippsiella trochoidea, Strain CCMP3099" /LENGTH=1084 /DNA_ID=CAMNT_0002591609 /DNA_START=80 /DNA_END=3334 /DNA_ORIENTATION=-